MNEERVVFTITELDIALLDYPDYRQLWDALGRLLRVRAKARIPHAPIVWPGAVDTPPAPSAGDLVQVGDELHQVVPTEEIPIEPLVTLKKRTCEVCRETKPVTHLEGKKATCDCLLYTSPSPRDRTRSRMPSSA